MQTKCVDCSLHDNDQPSPFLCWLPTDGSPYPPCLKGRSWMSLCFAKVCTHTPSRVSLGPACGANSLLVLQNRTLKTPSYNMALKWAPRIPSPESAHPMVQPLLTHFEFDSRLENVHREHYLLWLILFDLSKQEIRQTALTGLSAQFLTPQ